MVVTENIISTVTIDEKDFENNVGSVYIPNMFSFEISRIWDESEKIIRTEFFDTNTLFVVCSQTGKCSVLNFLQIYYETPFAAPSIINIGRSYSGIHVILNRQILAVSYSQHNLINFFHVPEIGCYGNSPLRECHPVNIF